MDQVPVKRRKISETIDLQTQDPGERPITSSTTQSKDEIHPSNHPNEGSTDKEDLGKGIMPPKSTVNNSSRAVTSSRPVEYARQVKAKVPEEVSSASQKYSTQKTDKGSAMDDAAVDDPPADGTSIDDASTTDSSTDDAATGEPDQRSGVRRSSTLPATPTTPSSRNNVDTPSSTKSRAVVSSDDDDFEFDIGEASRKFPGLVDFKLEFAGRVLLICTQSGIKNRKCWYELPKAVRLDLCQYMVRNEYITGREGATRVTLDNFYDQYNLRDPQKLVRARIFFTNEIHECAEKFTKQIEQDKGTYTVKVTTPSGKSEEIRYKSGYDHLLDATMTTWDGTMRRNYVDPEEAQHAVTSIVEDVLRLQDTFAKALGRRTGADTPTLVNTPTEKTTDHSTIGSAPLGIEPNMSQEAPPTPTPQPQSTSDGRGRKTPKTPNPRSRSTSESPATKTMSRLAEIRDFINNGSAEHVYTSQQFSELDSHFSKQLRRLRPRQG